MHRLSAHPAKPTNTGACGRDMEKNSNRGSQGTSSLPHKQGGERKKTSIAGTFLLACRVRLYNLSRIFQNIIHYYVWHPKFFLADFLLIIQYFFKSPYTLIREYDEKHPMAPVGPYGETDFFEFDRLLTSFEISPQAVVADLGSGRGRLAFFLKLVRGQSRVVAYEYLPIMVQRAKWVQKVLSVRDISFHHEDWHEANFAGVDVLYLYSLFPGLPIAKKLAMLPKTTKIITIGSWLGSDLPDSFQLIKKVPIRFVWGTTEAYLQTPVEN
jgi:hypothetical protein